MIDLLEQGLGFHQAGQLAEAEAAYRKVLSAEPNQPNALHLLGVLAHQLGRNDVAADLISRAVQLQPGDAVMHGDLGRVFSALHRDGEAGAVLERALALDPKLASGHVSLGVLRRRQGQWDEAETCFRRSIDLDPRSINGWGNLGSILFERGRLNEAAAAFARRLSIGPVPRAQNRSPQGFGPGRLAHDRDQLEYLTTVGISGPELAKARAGIDEALAALARSEQIDETALESLLNRPLHIEPAPAFAGEVISPALDAADFQARWRAAEAPILLVDGLLTSRALAGLQRFLQRSTIWYWCSERGSYVGAFDNAGLLSPLVVQIAEALRTRFPAIFGDHALKKMWAFKYCNEVPGISMHADEAAVNVNLWITPDEANLEPGSTGLTIWDRAAPGAWDFNAFNNEQSVETIQGFLHAAGAKLVPIAYRCNRAMIFDSTLFHAGNQIRFAPGYANRRMNLTLLFGDRKR